MKDFQTLEQIDKELADCDKWEGKLNEEQQVLTKKFDILRFRRQTLYSMRKYLEASGVKK